MTLREHLWQDLIPKLCIRETYEQKACLALDLEGARQL
jgi:hypothetical protein